MVRKDSSDRKSDKPLDEIDMNIINIIKFNQGLRVATAKRLIDNLFINKFIDTKDGCYVKFMTNKFSVVANGLANEFRYNNALFVQSFVEAHGDFYDDNKEKIKAFCIHHQLPFNGGNEDDK